MKRFLIALALLATFAITSEVKAQYVTLRAPVVSAPVVTPVRTYAAYSYPSYGYTYSAYPSYSVSPVVVGSAYATPVVSAPVVTTPVVRRPGYQFYSPYGGYEYRTPGRPVANTIRALVR
ncbi:hypothetical protein LOC67_26325 [Stieleria sp. JC731]|uniref:hypothetical protein n=1 Tax=Pirellulaceae TaxID=2691357 RepID=UPI001E3CF9C9|nr:hypothetical protein [Stieleria sp. JC731]MCC9604086.1 hypothetical protein [Stieleria sp. JC731]